MLLRSKPLHNSKFSNLQSKKRSDALCAFGIGSTLGGSYVCGCGANNNLGLVGRPLGG